MYEVQFEADTEWLWDKALSYWERKPYVSTTQCYTYVDIEDDHSIERFLQEKKIVMDVHSKYPSKVFWKKHATNFPLTGLQIPGRIINRFVFVGPDYAGPMSFPRGAKCAYLYALSKKKNQALCGIYKNGEESNFHASLIDLQNDNYAFRVTREEIHLAVFCLDTTYSAERERLYGGFGMK